ncbi:hypothetical protein, partial [Brevundimonas sp. UBA7534]|uniref:hypothetical protein n=1 Tax=Brevundimonas sp. UBA7534 TaxID=1946138 RepID=UPI0025B9C3B9
AHGRVAASGSTSRTGAAVKVGGDPAQLAVMTTQAIGAIGFKGLMGIDGAPGLVEGGGRDPANRRLALMKLVEAAHLVRAALGL